MGYFNQCNIMHIYNIVIVRGNPGVQNLNPYPTLNKPLLLIKSKGFEGLGSGFWRVEGYKGFVKGFILNALSNYKYKLLTSLLTTCKVIQKLISFYIVFMQMILLFSLHQEKTGLVHSQM